MASAAPRHSTDSLSPISPTPSHNEFPFPRLGSSSRYASRRGSVASSIHSIGGTLDTATHWNRLTESSQNAISTLLQPPIVRTGLLPHTSAPASSAHKPPTSRDIPPVALTNIKSVDPAEFKPYLNQVGALYDALQQAKDNEEEGGTQLFRKGTKTDDLSDLLDSERRSSKPSLSRQASLVSLASYIESPMLPRKKSSTNKRALHAPTPLSTIPSVYHEEDFHLENPRTFDVVSERSEVVRPVPGTPDAKGLNGNTATPRKALATNAILQEKLSWYMDTVEVHLISSISSASTSFFAALGSLKDLHSEAADSVARIKELRKELETLDQEMAVGGLTLVNQRRRRENLKQLCDAVQQLKRIVESVANCESLVDGGQVDEALDSIEALEILISGEEQVHANSIQLRDLRGATALQGVTNDLDILRSRIGKSFESRFLNALLSDLRHHVESISTHDTLQRWGISSQRSRGGHNREPSAYPAYLSINKEFRADILSILSGLHRAKHISPATIAYREAVLRELRNIIRRTLPASNEDDNESMMSTSTTGRNLQRTQQEKSSILARNLRALDPEDAEELLKKIYIGIGETLRRLGTQVKVLLDVTSTIADPTGAMLSPRMKSPSIGTDSPLSPNMVMIDGRQMGRPRGNSSLEIQEQLHQTLDMSSLLGQAVDIAQDRIVKILRVRSEQTIHLSVEKFLRYFNLNLLFANECEAVSGRSGTPLKNVVNGHIKDFIQQMGESERQNLATGMEADQWNAKDFSDEDNEHLSRILSASTQDAEAWTAGSKIWLAPSQDVPATTAPPNGSLAPPAAYATNGESGRSTPSSNRSSRPAMIESESFILPVSATLCMQGLSSFLHLTSGLPSMTTEIASSIISYLSLFNSRCTQLILGAGATRSAGLKNITTKHLALASQALSFISSLIPHVREFIRRRASTSVSISNLMGEFDKIRRSFLEHQQSIYDKLLDIMSGRASTHAKAMKLIDWETEKQGVNTYMEALVKETNTFHKVMTKHLPEGTMRMVMQPIFKAYREQWGKAYGDVVLGSEAAQNRMLRDAEYFKSRIGALDGAGDTGDYILEIVREKPVPKPEASTKVASATNGTLTTKAADEVEASNNSNTGNQETEKEAATETPLMLEEAEEASQKPS
ncbi:Vps54-like protein-domain-containing protein [Bisporella sp. PMI_857]|nr:Vps54-like protein-domain-containing protein [Bisporella sp. PMI_857]